MIIAERILVFICILIAVTMVYQYAYVKGFSDGMDKSRTILDTILYHWEDDDGEEDEEET